VWPLLAQLTSRRISATECLSACSSADPARRPLPRSGVAAVLRSRPLSNTGLGASRSPALWVAAGWPWDRKTRAAPMSGARVRSFDSGRCAPLRTSLSAAAPRLWALRSLARPLGRRTRLRSDELCFAESAACLLLPVHRFCPVVRTLVTAYGLSSSRLPIELGNSK
jgi:hypothetical protein